MELEPCESDNDASDSAPDLDVQFRAFKPLPNMMNFNLSVEVGMRYSNKDAFLVALKWHSIKNSLSYYVTKSCFKKFETKCAIKDERCKWKIMASIRKKTMPWMVKKDPGPHTCVATGASKDHLRLDSNMIVDIILPMVKANLGIEISMLIVDMYSQYQYSPTYYKV
ncbi:hypothetical protein J1N35_018948 [Gossypium stocksii]|uniref:Transposase MuDR plant domain-containing protein n=1 Tax=Gossypium stocksii TaxID=47602 RepID=A0A9D4A7N7_9ROSI|nr:hypothetical protein J1N35_018948 [Gossypium stocksii]